MRFLIALIALLILTACSLFYLQPYSKAIYIFIARDKEITVFSYDSRNHELTKVASKTLDSEIYKEGKMVLTFTPSTSLLVPLEDGIVEIDVSSPADLKINKKLSVQDRGVKKALFCLNDLFVLDKIGNLWHEYNGKLKRIFEGSYNDMVCTPDQNCLILSSDEGLFCYKPDFSKPLNGESSCGYGQLLISGDGNTFYALSKDGIFSTNFPGGSCKFDKPILISTITNAENIDANEEFLVLSAQGSIVALDLSTRNLKTLHLYNGNTSPKIIGKNVIFIDNGIIRICIWNLEEDRLYEFIGYNLEGALLEAGEEW